MKIKVRITSIKKGDRFWNEYWNCEVIATTDAYRLDGTTDERYSATRPKPKVAVMEYADGEWRHSWWMIEVGVTNGNGGSGGWSEVEHRSIEVERDSWTEGDEERYTELRAKTSTHEEREELAELRQRRAA